MARNSSDPTTLNQQINDFSTLLCHELRTPLTSIRAILKMLSYEQFSHLSDEGRQLVDIAIGATGRLVRLADILENQTDQLPAMLSGIDLEKIKLESDIVNSLREQHFFLEYQPIIEMPDGRVVGFEALARWRHATDGLISPAVFIALAENNGTIEELGFFLLEKACQQLAIWQQEFFCAPPLTMSVNVSSLQLLNPEFSRRVEQLICSNQLQPGTLKLEITESALIQNEQTALQNLTNLKAINVGIHVDDFGTGYSCLARLQDFPFDALKIDRSFIHSRNWKLVETILLMASQLQLEVITEGIETAEQLSFLENIGCKKMQGYYFSRPIGSRQASLLLSNQCRAMMTL